MNKTELIAKVAQQAGMSKASAKKAVEAVIESVKGAIAEGDKVQIPGIMTLSVAVRGARTGKNPRTGEAITIAAKKIVKVKVGSELSGVVK